MHWTYNIGAYNSELFNEFLHELHEKLPSESILIMDNARIHTSACVKLTLEGLRQEYLMLPPYSPQLNPIEEFFAYFKQLQQQIRPRPTDQENLIDSQESNANCKTKGSFRLLQTHA